MDVNNKTLGWNDVCFQIPNIASLNDDDEPERKRRGTRDSDKVLSDLASSLHRMKRTGRPFNPSVDVAPFIFCAIVESLPIGCMMQNILEVICLIYFHPYSQFDIASSLICDVWPDLGF